VHADSFLTSRLAPGSNPSAPTTRRKLPADADSTQSKPRPGLRFRPGLHLVRCSRSGFGGMSAHLVTGCHTGPDLGVPPNGCGVEHRVGEHLAPKVDGGVLARAAKGAVGQLGFRGALDALSLAAVPYGRRTARSGCRPAQALVPGPRGARPGRDSVTGVARGLQNRGAGRSLAGRFDSGISPFSLTRQVYPVASRRPFRGVVS
jgi:hypothetical protein